MQVAEYLAQLLPWAAAVAAAALGEVLVERSGKVNLGLEGIFYLSSAAAAYAAYAAGSTAAGFAAAAASGAAVALLFAALVVLLGLDQIVVGLSLVFLGVGLGDVVGARLAGAAAPSLPRGQELALAAVVLTVLPAAAYVLLYRHWWGYFLRAAGEDEDAARFMGVPVAAVRVLACAAEGVLAGLAGAYFMLGPANGRWSAGRALGWGWIALGMVILGYWHPLGASAAAVLYAALYVSTPALQELGVPAPLADSTPYVAVVASLAVASWLYEKLGVKPPASIWRR
ncbi:MAG: hypothetical protein ABWW70_03315 [Thermoproteota archaeon]